MSRFDFKSKTDQRIVEMARDIEGYSSEFQEAIREELQRRNLQAVLDTGVAVTCLAFFGPTEA